MVNSSDFGNRLQKILDFYNISATELSNQISFNRSTISHLLSGRNKPSLDFVMKLLQKFPEVELYWLLNGKGSFPSVKNTPSSVQTLSKKTPPTEKEDHLTGEDAFPEVISNSFNDTDVDRIVVFFKNGTFKSYKN
jgi:transcriptional regulator with XRE-family HTH domain